MKKKKLSAHERKMLKKKQQGKNSFAALSEEPTEEERDNEREDDNEDKKEREDESDEEGENESQTKKPVTKAKPVQYKRGQKAKAKKMKEKYGWQDEEDRKVHMKLLGVLIHSYHALYWNTNGSLTLLYTGKLADH